MTQLERAMLDIKEHAGRPLKIPLEERSAVLAITAMTDMEWRQKMHCKNCEFAKRQSRVGDGVNEPPYVVGFFCKRFSIFPLDDEDFCSYFEEKAETTAPATGIAEIVENKTLRCLKCKFADSHSVIGAFCKKFRFSPTSNEEFCGYFEEKEKKEE